MALKKILNKLKSKKISFPGKKVAKKPIEKKVLNVADLIGKFGVAINIPKDSDKFSDGWDSMPAVKFTERDVMLVEVKKQTDKFCYLRYNLSDGREVGVYVPNTLEVFLLEGKDKESFEVKWQEQLKKNLSQHLGHAFYVGSDPEIFVEDEKGIVIPAFDFLGSKEKPNKTIGKGSAGFPLYWDGFQAEFTTAAMGCLAYHVDSVQAGLNGCLIEARKKNPKAKLSIKTVMEIPNEMLRSAKEEHVQFGCMPSLNAYGMKGRQENGRDVPFRSAGGHIHFGCGKMTSEEISRVVKALDAVLGVACVSLFAKYDNPKRRQLYGLAGEYRLPPHGLEYRPLSNAWLFHPMIMHLTFDLARKAFMFGKKDLLKFWDAKEEETIRVINECDVTGAQAILKRNKVVFMQLLKAAYGNLIETHLEVAYDIFMKGIDYAVQDVTNFEKNWALDTQSKVIWATHSDGEGKQFCKAFGIVAKGNKVA